MLVAVIGCDDPTCPRDFFVGPASRSCSTREEIEVVGAYITDFYLFSDQLAPLRTEDFSSPEALLESALEQAPAESGAFGFLLPLESEGLSGHDRGYGMWLGTRPGRGWVIVDVLGSGDTSPASEAGLARGDVIVAIDGAPLIGQDLQPALSRLVRAEAEVELSVAREGGRVENVLLVPRAYREPPWVSVQELERENAAYLLTRNLDGSQEGAMVAALESLSHLRRWVIDLRFSNGAAPSVVFALANHVLGAQNEGEALLSQRHLERHSDCDVTQLVARPEGALEVEEVVLIHGPGTGSFADQIWNTLRPFVPVRVVGQRNGGSPLGAHELRFCRRRMAVSDHALANRDGGTVPASGVPLDCIVEPDLERRIGDPEEALLAAARAMIRTGTCPLASPPPAGRSYEALACAGDVCVTPLL